MPSKKPSKQQNTSVAVIAACVLWFALWLFVPGMHWTPLNLWFDDPVTLTLLETAVTVIVIAITLYVTRRRARQILGIDQIHPAWWLLPLVLAIAVPLAYHLELPPYVYVVWMAVSVFWQQYLTYGLLQPYLVQRLGVMPGSILTIVMFYLGHAIVLPQQFLPISLNGALMTAFIFIIGINFAWLRQIKGHIASNLIVHWAFYFIVK